MSTTLTTKEARVLRSARECAEQCDVARARRTEPTPQQTEAARRDWHVPKLTRWLAQQKGPRFPMTYCSQCGCELGPGDAGVSHCSDHRKAT